MGSSTGERCCRGRAAVLGGCSAVAREHLLCHSSSAALCRTAAEHVSRCCSSSAALCATADTLEAGACATMARVVCEAGVCATQSRPHATLASVCATLRARHEASPWCVPRHPRLRAGGCRFLSCRHVLVEPSDADRTGPDRAGPGPTRLGKVPKFCELFGIFGEIGAGPGRALPVCP
jgi:hypothetical protein